MPAFTDEELEACYFVINTLASDQFKTSGSQTSGLLASAIASTGAANYLKAHSLDRMALYNKIMQRADVSDIFTEALRRKRQDNSD